MLAITRQLSVAISGSATCVRGVTRSYNYAARVVLTNVQIYGAGVPVFCQRGRQQGQSLAYNPVTNMSPWKR